MSKRIRKKPRTRSAKARTGAVQYEQADTPSVEEPQEEATPSPPSQLATQGEGRPSGFSKSKDVRTGTRRKVDRSERIKRAQLVSALMSNGTPALLINDICADQFGMTKAATTRLCGNVLDQWAEDEEQQRPQYKRAAMRRIHGHIAAAKKPNPTTGKVAWAAVAQFENLLARIQGTLDPLVIEVNLEATVRENILHVVSGLDADRLVELAERALAYREPAPLLTAPVTVVEQPDAAAE